MQELSLRNPRVSQIRGLSRQRKVRNELGAFVIEGPKLIAEAISAGVVIRYALVEAGEEWAPTIAPCVQQLKAAGVDVSLIPEESLGRLLPTASPQPIVAVADALEQSLSCLFADAAPTFVVAAEGLNDPGNAGTILRSSLAAGADAFVALGSSVDFASPKVVRASAGALFRLPVATAPTEEGLAQMRDAGLTLLGAAGGADDDCTAVDLTRPLALVMGTEAHGLTSAARDLLDQTVRIPLPGPVESLNVAMATTILTWEVCRQRSERA